MIVTLLPALAWAQSYPEYNFKVHLHSGRHLVSGVLHVKVTVDDERPRDVWWFRLPPNRFLEQDPRGIARDIAPYPMGIIFSKADPVDPMLPSGFSTGSINIVSVEDEAGRRLSFNTEADPNLRTGMWRDEALMRVFFAPESNGREVKVHFVTTLPERHKDGWSEIGILAEQWHPLLLGFHEGAWARDAYTPAGARFSMQLKVDQAGWLKAGPLAPRQVEAENALNFQGPAEPQRAFPLIYLAPGAHLQSDTAVGRVDVFYQAGNERVARRTAEIAEAFVSFAQGRFGLPPPESGLTFIQSGRGTGEITTVGDTILIPTVYFKNNTLLDRVYTGKLTRAIAELWFGERVWSNRNTDAWLHLGLTGFLALEYFEFTYGWDAPVHDVVDWLSPRYREHYFESIVLGQIRGEEDVPLGIPIYHHPFRDRAMTAVYQKAPLVMRALKFVMGGQAFDEGLREFYESNRYQLATMQGLQNVMETAGGEPLDWFFDSWFRGTTMMDYALGEWESIPTPDGHKLVLEVIRLEPGVMPVDFEINLEDGRRIHRMWNGEAEHETLEFSVPGPVESIRLDPQEYLLETSRTNNHSSADVRWRPFYDWSKERETLVTIISRLGGNAIDGNIIGIGTQIKINATNSLTLLPIYGENSDEALFEAAYSRSNFIGAGTNLELQASKIGGARKFSTGLKFSRAAAGNIQSTATYSYNIEEVEAASIGGTPDAPIQQPGNTNNLNILYIGLFGAGEPNASDLTIELEHSQPAMGSDFKYSSVFGNFGQQWDFHVNHAIRFELIRGLIDGSAPIQKQHLLGDPLVLRGYPRTVSLLSDNIAALRLEYQYVATRRIFGESIQNRKLTLLFFGDVGKGWNRGESSEDAITRRDVGIGFNMDLSLLNTLNFPLRVELAYPVGDPEFKDRQVILLQALSFF